MHQRPHLQSAADDEHASAYRDCSRRHIYGWTTSWFERRARSGRRRRHPDRADFPTNTAGGADWCTFPNSDPAPSDVTTDVESVATVGRVHALPDH